MPKPAPAAQNLKVRATATSSLGRSAKGGTISSSTNLNVATMKASCAEPRT